MCVCEGVCSRGKKENIKCFQTSLYSDALFWCSLLLFLLQAETTARRMYTHMHHFSSVPFGDKSIPTSIIQFNSSLQNSELNPLKWSKHVITSFPSAHLLAKNCFCIFAQPACHSLFSVCLFFRLCCSAGQNLGFLLIPSAFCCGWHVSGMTRVATRHPGCPLRCNRPSQITLAWHWPVFRNASQAAAAPTGGQRRIKQPHAAISLCSKYPFSTFYKCAVFIIRNPSTARKKKKKARHWGEGTGNGKGWGGVGGMEGGCRNNYSQTNLLFRHGARKTSVPAPPVIQEVLFFCSSLCFPTQMWK